MRKAIVEIPQEQLVNEYCPIVANKLNFFMDLQTFNGISFKTMYEVAENGRLYSAAIRATIGYYIAKDELEGLVKIAQDHRDSFENFVSIKMEDTGNYRKAMQSFIDKAPFSEKSTFKKNVISEISRGKLFQISGAIKDIYLRYCDVFIDNPF